LSDVRISLARVAQLEAPTKLLGRPGSDLVYVAQRAGRVVALEKRGDGLAVAVDDVLDLSGDTTTDGERGLLGLAFSPDGATLYVSHTNQDGDSRIAAYAMDGEKADASSRTELLAVDQPFANHNGGEIVVDSEGLLWIGFGDGGSGDDPDDRAQDPADLLGKLLRIDPERGAGDRPYGIPPGNPYADGGGRPEIAVIGVRNPWRFRFDRDTGDLWVGDVGQNAIEEIDRLPAREILGTNLGWSAYEGSDLYQPDRRRDEGRLVGPTFEMDHEDGWCSVTGGPVYRGDRIPALQGAYLFGDFCKTGLQALTVTGGDVAETAVLGGDVGALVSIDEDLAGEVYLLSLDGEVYRVEPAG